jgi:glucose/arabinose dehydrogenase
MRHLLLSTIVLCTMQVHAQKGIAPKNIFSAAVHSKYPQHLDFKESMARNLKVPEGFSVHIAATGLGKPRIMAITDEGYMYVTRRDQGDVLLLKDKDNDGRFDDLRTVMSKFPDVHGITIYKGDLYLCSSTTLKRAHIQPDGSLTDTITLVNDLPEGAQHDNRMIAFGPDDKLYISVGSSCNDCAETNAEKATILVADKDGKHRKIFARGLRNTIGFDWQPQTKELWGADNGMDWRGDTIPGEELNRIVENGDYGWPWVYNNRAVDESREDPPGTTKAAYAKGTVPSVMDFPAHAAPIDFRFIGNAPGFPEAYKDDALVAWHGSWNRLNPEGYKVQRILFENGKPVGVEDFFSGFLSADGETRFGRPAGIIISKKGVIYIADDENGVIYSVKR